MTGRKPKERVSAVWPWDRLTSAEDAAAFPISSCIDAASCATVAARMGVVERAVCEIGKRSNHGFGSVREEGQNCLYHLEPS